MKRRGVAMGGEGCLFVILLYLPSVVFFVSPLFSFSVTTVRKREQTIEIEQSVASHKYYYVVHAINHQ